MANKLTPMMQQYMEIKEQYRDCILFFRLGDFYEMFFDDALKASKAMEVTLTGKSCGLEERAPMCGVPYHAADVYIQKLIEKGFKVAICEQTEDPATAKGIVRREVIKIITPGTVVGQTMLQERENNYLASVYCTDEKMNAGGSGISGSEGSRNISFGLVYCDISTGELQASEYSGKDAEEELLNELVKIHVREVLLSDGIKESSLVRALETMTNAYVSFPGEAFFDEAQAERSICRQFTVKSLTGLGLTEGSAMTLALGGLLQYLTETQKQSLDQLIRLRISDHSRHMILDKAAIRNLELTETLFEKKVQGSLLGVLDCTCTAMGSRMLKKWIREPRNAVSEINARLDAVELLMDDLLLRNNLRISLKSVYDLERLSGRIASGNANARDLLALQHSVAVLPELRQELLAAGDTLLADLGERIDELKEVYDKISVSILEEPPVTIRDGGLMKEGYSKALDEIKAASADSIDWIMGLEARERERTGIKNLKVGFNKVFGYYIEVTKKNSDGVPEDYMRKQTLVNCERYITPEMKEKESLVLNAEARINALEYELFTELRDYLKGFTETIQDTAEAVSELDVLVSFAEVSAKNGYVKPEVNDGDRIHIVGGRHPVIEQTMDSGIFVSNDTEVDRSGQSLLLITGPNMAGKSTYMRQTALIVLMAQMGCFVPAESAEIGIVDRVYTRIGASDNLTQGQSTFFVEMNELAYILNTATERSLVILDEIGRGTSTYDGLSIAWAVVEFLCRPERRIRTLFASHYHELTALEGKVPGFCNYNVSVSENDGEVVFLHKIIPGSASRSYGIHVARIAGVPELLLQQAQEKLKQLEANDTASEAALQNEVVTDRTDTKRLTAGTDSNAAGGAIPEAAAEQQLSFLTELRHPVLEKIKEIDIMSLTPSGAIALIEEWKKAVEE